jgi:phospho-N-acetylmuramoyl-pentapeptide-transferase
MIAAAVSLVIGLLGTPLWIRLVRRLGYGQMIREEGPQAHISKRGTPTMGGTVILIGTVVGYAVGHGAELEPPTASGLLVLFLMVGLGVVGFVDDYIKVFKQRSLGLRAGAKTIGIIIIGVVFAFLSLRFPNGYDMTPATPHLSFLRDFGPTIGPYFFVLWALLMINGWSNAINLTDGLDGLAAGTVCMVLGAYVLIGLWQFRNSCSTSLVPKCYTVRDPLDLAVVAAAVAGACFGFLWWNAPPAKIFMGDTGSLCLGGVIVGLAITTQTQLLLLILAGLPLIITMSVMIQVGTFKVTSKLNGGVGKRVFKMAPLQHHFELSGWAETTIVVRFWLISGLCIAAGLGLFYLEWMPK